MEVKVCPQCAQENRSDRPFCSECKTSLVEVQPTQSAAAPPSSAPNTYGPAFQERPSVPYKRGLNWGAIVLVVVILCGAGFAGWWAYNKYMKPGPDKVVQQFIDASKAGDFDKMKACLCQSMVNMIDSIPGAEQQAKRQMTSGGSNQFDGRITGVTYDPSNSDLAYINLEPATANPSLPGMRNIEIVCCKENGAWKIDFNATGLRAMAKARGNK